MAKRITKPKAEAKQDGDVAAVTPVRKTVKPRAAKPATSPIAAAPANALTHDRIAERAYHIAMSGNGGSDLDNWMRAEAELRGEAGSI